MGVLGLWQLLAPVGQPVTLESLENKIFAVDISIWLNQAVKGYRDAKGESVPNAHLHSLFSRLCKLMFYKIRPVIVFDGGYPELKKQTIINRQQRRAAVKQSSRDIGLKILSNYLASQNLAQLRGEINGSPKKKTIPRPRERPSDDLYILPPLPDNPIPKTEDDYQDYIDSVDWKHTEFSKEDIRYLNQIDLESEEFKNLPPDMKQEILATLKASRKHRSWEQYAELPEDSDEFSRYQMKCLLKKRNLSQKLEEVQKDLRQMNTADFVAQYTNDHVIGETNKIMSDDCSHYVLLKKIIHNKKSVSNKLLDESEINSSMTDTKNAFITNLENIDIDDVVVNENISTFKDVKVKQEVESDSEDVDNLPLRNANNSSININPEKPKDSLNIKTILNSKKLENDLNSASDDTNDQINLLKEREKHTRVDKNEDLNKREESISSDDELIPCEEMEPENIIPLLETHTPTYPTSINTPLLSTSSEKSKDVSVPTLFSNTFKDAIMPDEEKTKSIDQERVHDVQPLLDIQADKNLQLQQDLELATQLQLEEDSKTAQALQTPFESKPVLEPVPSTSFSKQVPLPKPLSEKEKAEMMAKNLQLQEDLDTASSLLEADRAKQDRQSNTVQDHMVEECKELLKLFGVPYVVGPAEAEAQCAFYDAENLTHGTITDDSDVWLFGGKRVYKNFFAQHKHVEFYKGAEIFAHFGLSRKKLINFALLTGSDYTVGIEGVGPVTAMEILSEFPGDGIEGMVKFKEWWKKFTQHAIPPENKVRAKLSKLVLGERFPDSKVVDAYLNPDVDHSTEKFSWGRPDLDALRDYAREKFGWNKAKVDDALLPVIKKLNERDAQTHIDNFFSVNLKKQKDLFPSKRIMSALKKIKSPEKGESSQEPPSGTNKRKGRAVGKKTAPRKKEKKSAVPTKTVSEVKPKPPVLSEESSDED